MSESVTIVLPLPNRVLQPNHTVGSIGMRMQKAAAIKRYRRLTREAVLDERIKSMPWDHVRQEAT
jgi:hypothetical protein